MVRLLAAACCLSARGCRLLAAAGARETVTAEPEARRLAPADRARAVRRRCPRLCPRRRAAACSRRCASRSTPSRAPAWAPSSAGSMPRACRRRRSRTCHRGIDWNEAFRDRSHAPTLNFRRKQDDREFLVRFPLGIQGGRIPRAARPDPGPEARRRSCAARRWRSPAIKDFDELPTPFRAVAADLETGERRRARNAAT